MSLNRTATTAGSHQIPTMSWAQRQPESISLTLLWNITHTQLELPPQRNGLGRLAPRTFSVFKLGKNQQLTLGLGLQQQRYPKQLCAKLTRKQIS